MDKSEQNDKKPGQGRRFSQKQYEMLLRCSESKDISEWNQWRENNPGENILLEAADFNKCCLPGAYLNTGSQPNFTGKVHLEGANFTFANLEKVRFDNANLENAELGMANLHEAVLMGAHLEHAHLIGTYLVGAKLQAAHLIGASFFCARLEGANLSFTHMQGTEFELAIVDGFTLIWNCTIDQRTDFRGVGLENARLDERTRELLKYNVRRLNWEDWYKEHWILKWPLKSFWWVSDYGMSIGRIIVIFFMLAFLFALAYCVCPNCIMVYDKAGDIRGFLHAFYFSIVTMTTLGFGDIAANPDSNLGQVLLMLQVILGYFLFGALITRFAVLFTAGGPAGKLADENKKVTKDTRKRIDSSLRSE